ncbi:MAG: hypothetical protein Q7T73_04565 [Beijerinckiaceae bacterium]|nr:hypothetical protein [Beijerinckiaceae bacterium]
MGFFSSVFGSIARGSKRAAYRFEEFVGSFFRAVSKPFRRRSSGVRSIEAPIEKLVGSLARDSASSSGVAGRIESLFAGIVPTIQRLKLNYFFVAFFGAALVYEFYLLSQADSPTTRQQLLTSIRFTIYFAIIFFSIVAMTTSQVRPWRAIFVGWMGVFKLIYALPLAFVLCFCVYMGARALMYLPASFFAGRETAIVIGNFFLGMIFFIVLAFVTARIYDKAIADKPVQDLRSRQRFIASIILVAVGMWFVNALAAQALGPLPSLVPRHLVGVMFQVSWLLNMLWTSVSLYIIPAVVIGALRPVRLGVAAGVRVIWITLVVLIIANLPGDIYEIAAGMVAPRLPTGMASRVAVDVVAALVNSIVYFASQTTVLVLFVAIIKQYGLIERTEGDNK